MPGEAVDAQLLDGLRAKLESHERMLAGLQRLAKVDPPSPTTLNKSTLLREELLRRIRYLEGEIEAISVGRGGSAGGGPSDDLPALGLHGEPPPHEEGLGGGHPFMEHWMADSQWSRGQLIFRIQQLRERLRTENAMAAALQTLCLQSGAPAQAALEAGPIEEGERWKSISQRWQLYLTEVRVRYLEAALRFYTEFVPAQLVDSAIFETLPPAFGRRALSGTINVKVLDVCLPDDQMASLMVQVYADGVVSEPMKLKRGSSHHQACALSTEGISLALKHSQTLEIVVFEKSAKPVGFIFFRLAWLQDYLASSFDRSFSERLDLIPAGSMRVSIRMSVSGGEDEVSSRRVVDFIHRQKVIKRKVIRSLGHDFVSLSSGPSILKCSHCHELIYSGNSVHCQKCRFACHKNCTGSIHVRSHTLVKSSSLAPTFCCHCGHLASFGGAHQGDSYRCIDCNIHVHDDCETYVPALCGLRAEVAEGIVQALASKQSPRASRGASQRMSPTMAMAKVIPSRPPFVEEQFEYISLIGKGNFGKVVLARDRESGKLFALKILKKASIIDVDERESLLSERYVFSCVATDANPFLVQCYGVFQSSTHIFFAMEYVGGGDLMFHIQTNKFTADQAKLFAAEVLLALEYLHRRNILYRDLKLDNILLALDGHIKLADYGLCKANMAADATTRTFCGTSEFMAPEILKEKAYTRSVDWWAFGVLVYELLYARAPFYGKNDKEIFRAIISGPLVFPPQATEEAKNFIQRLLDRNPQTRLGSSGGSEAIKRHAFFASIDFAKLAARKIPSSFKPPFSSSVDVSNFDPEFTRDEPVLTPSPSFSSSEHSEAFFSSITGNF